MKNYLTIFFVCFMMNFPFIGNAQIQDLTKTTSSSIEDLSVFPNPVKNGELHIITKYSLPKTIKIYDVLGKQVIATSMLGETLNISRLSPGLYILKITENKLSSTRKLVVR